MPTSIIFDYATITAPADASNKFRVMDATIFGSNDTTNNKSWQFLGSINVNTIPATDISTLTKDTGSATLYRAQAYKTFRIVINKVVGGGLTNGQVNVSDIQIFGFQTPTPTPVPVKVKQTYTLDLVSFLGKLSKSFVPLHNGYRLQLRVNNPTNCISFTTVYGDNFVYYTSNDTSAVAIDSYRVQPQITKFSIKNVRLSANILEVSPHLDGKIAKTVHTLGFKYQNDPLQNNIKQRILPELKSLNKVYLAMRRRTKRIYDQYLGFRLTNNLNISRLSYNDAVVREYSAQGDMYKGAIGAMEERFARYVDYDDYTTSSPNSNGTKGNQALVMALPFWRDCYVTGPGTYPWFYPTSRYTEDGVLIVDTVTPTIVTPINSYFAGKFLIGYDCRLPGAEDGQITGIDTSKHVLVYEMISGDQGFTDTLAMVDVFMEHDAFVHVDPGKSTAVSF